MKFDPLLCVKNIRSYGMPEPDLYDFEVVRAEDMLSKKHVPMIKLYLRLNKNNQHNWIIDYLPSNTTWKIKQFLHSIGMNDLFEKGEVHIEDCILKKGILKIIHVEHETYGIQAKVESYLNVNEE